MQAPRPKNGAHRNDEFVHNYPILEEWTICRQARSYDRKCALNVAPEHDVADVYAPGRGVNRGGHEEGVIFKADA